MLPRFLFTFLLLALHMLPAQAERKLALVIGINNYQEVTKLDKAVGDAEAIAQALSGLGFSVNTSLDADRRTLNLALSKLYASIEPGDTVLIHYSGHGIQISNENYLLPADVPAPTDGNVELLKSESLRLDSLVDTLSEKGAGASILIIDACRNNPFASAGKRAIGGARGLANIATAKGSFVMYSAAAGQTALDRLGDADPNATSVYTRVLLSRFANPNVKLRDLAASVRDEVEKMGKTIGHEQRPAYYDDLPEDFTLGSKPTGQTPPPPPVVVVAPPPPPVMPDKNEEARLAWETVKDLSSAAAMDTVAKRYPATLYGELAAARARELRDQARKQAEQDRKKAEAQVADVPPEEERSVDPPPSRGNLRWGVVLGSFKKSDTSKARSRMKAARAQGFDAQLIDTDDYGRLTPGLFAVVIAADNRSAALELAAEVQNVFGDAFAKQFQ
jgi:Caspase domain